MGLVFNCEVLWLVWLVDVALDVGALVGFGRFACLDVGGFGVRWCFACSLDDLGYVRRTRGDSCSTSWH